MNEIKWVDPRPLRQSADAIPFPLDALPSVLRNMVQAISVTTSTDVGMAGTAMLSAVGYCFTGLYRLAGKADHTEPPVLYSIIIAQPSERKSPVMHFIKAPFDSFESKYNKDHREEMYKAQQDVKALEARVKSMEKEDEPDTAAIAKLRVQADNIRNTTPIRIAVDDITPESLVIELIENDSLLMISDEAGMLSNFNGKYNGGIPNLDLLLKSWNGEKYICNRVIRGRTEIPRPYLSVSLAGQPYIWDNMMNDTAFRSSGLITRFVHCFAKSDVEKRRYDTAPISKEVREQYHDFIHQLLKGKKDLHFDYIPVGHYKRGQDVQNGIAQALKEMGYGKGKQAIARWRAAEVEVLNKICLEHGIKPLAPEKARGTLEVEEYKEQRRQADELAVQNTQARYQLELKKTMLASTETQLAEQKKLLGDTQQQVREATADLIEQEQKLEDGETELSEVKEKVSKAKQEYERQQQKSQSIMCFLPDLEKDRKLEMEFDNYHNELRDMLKSPVSIIKHKDGIKSVVDKMEDLVIKAQDKSHKADLTIYDLRANQENFDQLYDAEQAKSKALSSQVQTLTSEKSALAKKYNATMAVYRQVERIAPDVIEQAKRLVEAEKQREQAQQIEYQPTRKKKSWGLE